MNRENQQQRKDAAHLWFGLATAAVVAGGVAFAVWRNGVEDDRARIAAYAGRAVEPNRAPLIWTLVATVLVAALVALAWRYTVRRSNAALASTPDDAALDHLFAGDVVVPIQKGHGGMSHATLVAGARHRGYTLTSLGDDGSMVFELSRPQGPGQETVPAQQPQDQTA